VIKSSEVQDSMQNQDLQFCEHIVPKFEAISLGDIRGDRYISGHA